MNSATESNSKIQEAMAARINPEYDSLPESIKAEHTRTGYAWLGSQKYKIVEQECSPDFDVVE